MPCGRERKKQTIQSGHLITKSKQPGGGLLPHKEGWQLGIWHTLSRTLLMLLRSSDFLEARFI